MTAGEREGRAFDDEVRVLVSKLNHDVGKYIARTAINLASYPLVPALMNLLVDDLYRLDGEAPASEVFERYAGRIEQILGPVSLLDACREKLKRVDALESRIRTGDEVAAKEAASLALDVSWFIRELRAMCDRGRA